MRQPARRIPFFVNFSFYVKYREMEKEIEKSLEITVDKNAKKTYNIRKHEGV